MTSTDHPIFRFDNTFVKSLAGLYIPWHASTVPKPELTILNEGLCKALNLDPNFLKSTDGLKILSGNKVPEGASPCALAYAGHQFGHLAKLGDGRALLLGEIVTSSSSDSSDSSDNVDAIQGDIQGSKKDHRYDLHFKGSGPTPYARRGDGKATLGPMLREYLISEAMHNLGISTTRILSVVETGEKVRREIELPGAVLLRVASSHIRVGTFELAAMNNRVDLVKRLADYSINRHYPELLKIPVAFLPLWSNVEKSAGELKILPAASLTEKKSAGELAILPEKNLYLTFLEEVCESQAKLVASWMSVGFVHGVLNTDNVLISGETIDYGPCAFIDEYDPATVFSSIDEGGRYAYDKQPSITEWNLQKLACALKELIGDEGLARNVVKSFSQRYQKHWLTKMKLKLGLLDNPNESVDIGLITDLLKLIEEFRADFTLCFRYLSSILRGNKSKFLDLFSFSYGISQENTELSKMRLEEWINRWLKRLTSCTTLTSPESELKKLEIANYMDTINPIFIPRNFHVENALTAAVGGDMKPFIELLDVLKYPFIEIADPSFQKYAFPESLASTNTKNKDRTKERSVCYKTFCGT